jgi:hypothetical protein
MAVDVRLSDAPIGALLGVIPEVIISLSAVVVPEISAFPCTENVVEGVVVPIPTSPVFKIEKSVVVALAVEDAIAKSVRCDPVAPFGVAMVRVAYGVEVPMPTLEAKYEVSVVVAPPFMTRPEASAPAPIVEEATESKPPETIKLLLTVDEPDAIKLPCVTRPMLDTLNSVVVAPCCVEDAITNSVRCAPVAPLGVATVSVPHGVEVPIPTLEAK